MDIVDLIDWHLGRAKISAALENLESDTDLHVELDTYRDL